MLRKVVTTLTMVVIGLLALPALAFAGNPPYPAPPVDPGASNYVPAATDSAASTTSLASTGADFSVGTAVLIGVAVVLVGLILAFAGNRVRKSAV